MAELPVQPKQIPRILRGPNYYDSPEGRNPWEKIWGISKYAILGASFVSIGDAVMITKAKNIVESANVAAFWMIPTVSLAATWASVTYIATNVRNKDDSLNYIIGVIACMPILQAWSKKTSFTMWSTAALVGFALLKRHSHKHEWLFFPKVENQFGKYDVYDYITIGKTGWPRRPY